MWLIDLPCPDLAQCPWGKVMVRYSSKRQVDPCNGQYVKGEIGKPLSIGSPSSSQDAKSQDAKSQDAKSQDVIAFTFHSLPTLQGSFYRLVLSQPFSSTGSPSEDLPRQCL